MKIILLKDVKKIGKKFEVKDVADGYAINMLIPNELALPATVGNVNLIATKRKAVETISAKTELELQTLFKDINNITLKMLGKVNDKGHLFAGIHKAEICEALKLDKGINLEPADILLEKPIKEIGEHKIIVKSGEQTAEFKLLIEGEIS